MKKLLHHYFWKKREELPFIILFSFLVTFGISRTLIYLIEAGRLPELFLYVNGVHVHHLSYGIFILAWVGFYTLVFAQPGEKLYKTSLLYGIGLGLTFDEFGMWLHLRDDYWIRRSYDAVVIIALLLLNIVYFGWFWNILGSKVKAFFKRLFRHPEHE